MTNIWKRSLSMFLAFVMVFGMIPVNAFATDAEEIVEEILDEEVFEEEIFEEEIVEEIFEEEVFEEEVFEEEPVEEIFEEEIVEEIVEEEVIDFQVSDNAAAAEAEQPEDETQTAEGEFIIWVNKTKQEEEISDLVLDGKVKGAVLDAVGYTGDRDAAVVSYDGMDVTGAGYEYEAGLLDITTYEYFALQKGETLSNEVSGSGTNTAKFVVTDANGAVEYPITFRDNRIKVKVTFGNTTVSNFGELAEADLTAELKSRISVTGDDPTTEGNDNLAITAYSFAKSEYQWPNGIDTTSTIDVVITMTDDVTYDLDNGGKWSATYTLEDTRGRFDVIYDVDGDETQYTVVEGNATPAWDSDNAEAVPTKDYYTFKEWTPAVAETVTGDATYTATWTANLDKNGNGEADQTENYTVWFYNGYGKPNLNSSYYVKHNNVAWGTKMVDLVPNEELLVRDRWNFKGWEPALVDAVEVCIVEGEEPSNDWVYAAVWTEHPVVYFVTPGTGVIDQSMTVEIEEVNGTVADPLQAWDGYHVEYWYVEGDATKAEYDFSTPVTENLTLVPVWFIDRNNNGLEDATADEPLTKYYWYVDGGEVEYTDRLAGEEQIDEETYYVYSEVAGDGRVFTGWDREESTVGAVTTVTFTAKFVEDLNDNEVSDDLEQVYFEIEGEGKVWFADEEVNGGYVLYDSTAESLELYAEPVVIDGISKTYVAAVSVDGDSVALNYLGDFSTFSDLVLTDYNSDRQVTVKVTFAEIAFTEGEMVLNTHVDGSAYTDKEVYDAVVAEPAYEDGDVTVLYKAHAEQTVELDVAALKQALIDKVGEEMFEEFKDMYYDLTGGDDTYTHTYNVEWREVTDTEVPTKKASDILDNLVNTINGLSLRELNAQKNTLMNDFKDELNQTGMHAFGAVEGSETVAVTYTDTFKHLEGTYTLSITDSRAETEIIFTESENFKDGVLTLAYGSFGVSDLLGHVVLNGAEGQVYVANDEIDKIINGEVGTYKIKVVFDATETAKAQEAYYTLKIEQAEGKVSFPKETLVINPDSEGNVADYSADATPEANTDYVHLIAGVDINTVQTTLVEGKTDNIKAKAWMKLPDELLNLLDEVNADRPADDQIVLENKTYTLSGIKELLNTEGLSAVIPAGAKTQIDNALSSIENMASQINKGGELYIDVVFVEKGEPMIFPEEMGFYVNMAVTVNKNYTTANATSMILIAPGVAMPGNGLTLVEEGSTTAQNIFTYTSGNVKKLVVKENVEASVSYYGLTTSANLHMSGLPTEAGLYIASATAKDGDKILSDAALVIVAPKTTSVNIDNDVVTFNGEKQMPNIIKDNADAAVTVITARVDLSEKEVIATVDFPAGINKLLEKIDVTLPKDVTLSQAIDAVKNVPATIEQKLKAPVAKIEQIIGKDADKYIDPVMEQMDKYFTLVCEKMEELQEQVGGEIVVQFADHTGYKNAGVYFYAAVVTDPDYIPTADVGYYVIETDKFALNDTVTAAGEDYMKQLVKNETGRDYVMVVSGNGNVNIRLDDTANSIRTKLAEILKVEDLQDGHAYPVSALEGQPTEKAEKLAEVLMAKVEEYAEIEIKGYSIPEKVKNYLLGKVEDIVSKTKTKLVNELEAQITEHANLTVTLNGDMPTAEGTYKVRALSYAVGYDEAVLTIEPASPYELKQSMQIWLIEPWALRANLIIRDNGVKLTAEEVEAKIDDYGVYFVRESELENALNTDSVTQDSVTRDDIIKNEGVIHYTKESGKIWYQGGKVNGLSCDFDEGIYTYELSDSVFVLYYIEIDGQTYYAPIRERNISEFVNKYKNDAVTFPDELERDVYAKLASLEMDTVKYRSQWENPQPLPIMDAPAIGSIEMGMPTAHNVAFSHSMQVVLIEPWGLKFNGFVTADKEYTDYGVVVYYDTTGKYSEAPTIDELLAEKNANVFSVNNGDAELTIDAKGRHQISAVYNKGVYTYQMMKNAYAAFYVVDGDNYYYGPVKTRTINSAIAGTLSPSTLQKNVLDSMDALYESIKAYRASKGYYDV